MARSVFEKRMEYQGGVALMSIAIVAVLSVLIYNRIVTVGIDVDFIVSLLSMGMGILVVLMTLRTLFHSSAHI
ncbi:MAG: hypothetical protein ACMXYL_05630 [Candidatus Woesearchaeota archaeon]